MQTHKNFNSLLELREFLVRLVSDVKDQELPSMEYYKDSIFRQIKAKGYTKNFSRKAKLYMENRMFLGMAENRTLYSVAMMKPNKKGFGVTAVCLKKISVEGNFYYIGNSPDNPRYFIVSPHLFQQYRVRAKALKDSSLDGAILDFMQTALLFQVNLKKIPDSKAGNFSGFKKRNRIGACD